MSERSERAATNVSADDERKRGVSADDERKKGALAHDSNFRLQRLFFFIIYIHHHILTQPPSLPHID